MPKVPNGVISYATGTVNVAVHFPNQKIQCQWCPLFLRYEDAFKRYSCRLTGEWIPDPFHQIGERCPLTFQDQKEE